MSGLSLWDAGYHDLVSVIPPGAKLSPNSSIKEDQLGKVPGKEGANGWYGYAWLKEAATKVDVKLWDRSGANVGLKASAYPALDIDSTNPALVDVISKFAEQELGWAPRRTGQAPKLLMPYRTLVPFARMAVKITYQGEEHLVEFLGEGRQYLVYGMHPSGVEYTWDRSLSDVDPGDLQLVTADRVLAFFAALKAQLEPKGIMVEVVGDGRVKEERVVEQDDLRAPDWDTLYEAVAAIPNDFETRDEYVAFGCAVKAAGGEEARAIFEDWALTWPGDSNNPEGNVPENVVADWERMHPPFRIGWQYIADLARGHEFHGDADADFAEFMLDVPDPTLMAAPEKQELIRALANSERWVTEKILPAMKEKVRYSTAAGWFVWSGTRWKRDVGLRAEFTIEMALDDLARDLHTRADAAPSKQQGGPLYKLAAKLSGEATLKNIIAMLRRRPEISIQVEEFDTDPWLLNTPDGVVDLRTGKIGTNEPHLMLSKETAVAPKNGDAPEWFRFLQEVTGGDRALQQFMQKQVGYALTGVTEEQTLTFVWGPSITGKSKFIEAISGLMGDYAETAPMDTFTSTKNDRHPTDIAGLVGARLVTTSETQQGRSWDEQRIKGITAGDKQRARFMRQDFFTFVPQFKLMIVGNHEPEIQNTDDAMRRRIHIVPFTQHPKKIDRQLGDKLKVEYPQILAWAIAGCLLWQEDGLEPPDSVLMRTRKYFDEEDLMQQWIDEKCDVHVDASATRSDLYRSWKQFCNAEGVRVATQTTFKRELEKKLPQIDNRKVGPKTNRLAGWHGVQLKEESYEVSD